MADDIEDHGPLEPLLQGVRVLDFGCCIAGPFCAAMPGDLGAEVIRVERLAGSEDRYIRPVMDSGEGALFLQVNRNQLSVTLNPMKPEGREVGKRLVASADVVVANMRTAFVAAYGTVAALMYRLKTGRGQQVKANLLRTALNVFQFNNIEAYLLGRERTQSGNRSQFGRPGDLFRTLDGWVQAQVVGQPLFVRWCEMLGERQWLDDPRFANDNLRSQNSGVLSGGSIPIRSWPA